MTVDYDPYRLTEEDVLSDAYVPYHVSDLDKKSIAEIRKCLDQGVYEDKKVLDEHVEFLESLVWKLEKILKDELACGGKTMGLENDLKSIKKFLNQLETMKWGE